MDVNLIKKLEEISKKESTALSSSGASARDIYAKSGRFIGALESLY